MCGIIGILGHNSPTSHLDKMLEAQAHRGPDNTGIFIEKNIALGHNRLAIIDCSPEADQPFHNSDSRYTIVFNGEIYNYIELRKELETVVPFRTQSDTEVLLAAYQVWGPDCLSRLNGMFAFAIWDKQEEILFAARDRFGVKPFYYSQHLGAFYFASEPKSLFAAGISQKPNEGVWATYFAYGSYGGPGETFWSTIHQLPGGYYMTVKASKVEVNRWYNFEKRTKQYDQKLGLEEVKEQYLQLLDDSINLRFRADVPIGFNVSGGVDSSALLALVNRRPDSKHIKAYTFYTGDAHYDELPWVKEVIGLTKNPLIPVKLDAGKVSVLAKDLALKQDEPYGGLPTIAYGELFKKARSQGIKVLLDGQGMDEQWAGYDYYRNSSGSVVQGVKKSPFRPQVLKSSFLEKAQKPIYPQPFENRVLNLQYRDLFYTKIPRALRFNDRVSMAASTELREPFLDYRLVEFAFAQPLDYKIKNDVQKYVLRQIVSEHLTDTVTYAPKRPLQTPQREWLAMALKPWVTQKVEELKSYPWFDADQLTKELNAYFNGDQDSSFHIWQWVNTALLLE